LREKWLLFLRNNKQHRTPEEWDRWWHAAGLGPTSHAYLLTWNPDRYSESQLSDQIHRFGPDDAITFGWSSGNNRSMLVGDRVFLLRQGREPKGLVGAGTVSRPPEETPHWEESSRADGKTSWIVEVRWEAVQTEPIIALPTLNATIGESALWSTAAGGV